MVKAFGAKGTAITEQAEFQWVYSLLIIAFKCSRPVVHSPSGARSALSSSLDRQWSTCSLGISCVALRTRNCMSLAWWSSKVVACVQS